MKRRSIIPLLAAAPLVAAAQNIRTTTTEGIGVMDSVTTLPQTNSAGITEHPDKALEFVPAEYELCKKRGHVKAYVHSPMSRFITAETTPAIFVEDNVTTLTKAEETTTSPGYKSEPDWNTCFYCHKRFRLVTRLDEE